MTDITDIAVVGGGLVGLMAAQCFAQSGCSVRHIYPKCTTPPNADYPISLRQSSQELLESLDLWTHEVEISSMRQLHISAVGQFGMLQIAPKNQTLAHVVSAQKLLAYMQIQVKRQKNIMTTHTKVVDVESSSDEFVLICERRSWKCRRMISADGVFSPLSRILGVRAKTYPKMMQSSICRVSTDGWPEGQGLIRKTSHSIMGCIPRTKNEGWVIATQLAPEKETHQPSVSTLRKHIEDCLSTRIGKLTDFELMSKKNSILQMRKMSSQARIIHIGNSCISTPPIGAQGLNMAIQDIAACQRIQMHTNWMNNEPMAWQHQLQAYCQPRHDSWYKKISLLMEHLRNPGPLNQLSEQAVWFMLGISQQAENQLKALGLGYG
jgi:2-polyprenyl-6-methoxyphenol hydroxylase-like FAD-dependent oxidoreductase